MVKQAGEDLIACCIMRYTQNVRACVRVGVSMDHVMKTINKDEMSRLIHLETPGRWGEMGRDVDTAHSRHPTHLQLYSQYSLFKAPLYVSGHPLSRLQ